MDIVVVGSCMTDLVSYTPRQPKPGETIHGSKFAVNFGGKGANQCVMASKFGAKVAMVAKVGKDSYGDNTLVNFKTLGISTDHVHQTADAMSGVASIIVSEDGQNSIVIVAGANLLLSEQDIMAAESLISSAKVVVCQLEVPPVTSLAALKLAKSHGVHSIFNPAPAIKYLDPDFYTVCDILCANETETELLTDMQLCDVESAKLAARVLQQKGCKTVIITLGENGSVVTTDGDVVHIPVTPIKPVDTTGAGDAFIGALAFYLAVMPKLSIIEAVRRSSSVASISCLSPGTQLSFPGRSDLSPDLFANI